MNEPEPPSRESLSREEGHPNAARVLTDDFFWDVNDEGAPLGTETGAETLAAFRDFRAERPGEGPLVLLTELLARWEIADSGWDAVAVGEVVEAGEEDEYSLLSRDEVILGLAFSQLVEEGRIDAEVQRRAVLATVRQALTPLLLPWGDRALERATRLERMKQVLSRPWA